MSKRKVKKILISQPEPSNHKSPYYDIAKKYHVDIHFRPLIKVEPVSTKEFRQQRIQILDFTAIIFTAKTAVDHFFSLCKELRVTVPETMKYFCVSESVALYLQKYIVYRKRKIFFSTTGKIEGLNNALTKHAKEKFLFPVPEESGANLTHFLDEKKVNYTKSVMYRTVSVDFAKDEKLDHDMLIFFSPFGVTALLKNFPDFRQEDLKIGCFGKATAEAIEKEGLRIDCIAPQGEFLSMTAALEAYLKENNA